MKMRCLVLLLLGIAVEFSTPAVVSNSININCNTETPENFNCRGSNVRCLNQKCACKPGFTGNPFLGCVPAGHKMCTMSNDPKLTTFFGEPQFKGINVPLPCRYLAAHFTVEPPELSGHPLKSCSVQVFTASRRFKGKYFDLGFEAETEYTTQDGQTGSFSFRAHADHDGSNYQSTLQWRRGNEGFGRSVPKLNQFKNAVGGSTIFDVFEDTKIELAVPNCGLKIDFRPVDVSKQTQTEEPGLQIAVMEEGYTVKYGSQDTSLCLSSAAAKTDGTFHTVTDISVSLKLDPDMAFTYRTLAHDISQTFPWTPKEACGALNTVLKECTNPNRREEAMESCYFMIEQTHFINCYANDEQSSHKLVQLFSTCMEAYCNRNTAKCNRAKTMISNAGCNHVARSEFVGFNCDYTPTD